MSDKSVLSQEEIDALLQGDLGLDDMDDGGAAAAANENFGPFTAEQARMLQEVADECFAFNIREVQGQINKDVALSQGRLRVASSAEVLETTAATDQVFVGINLNAGKAGIVISSVFGAMIASIMLQGEYQEDPYFTFGELQLGAIGECFNSVSGKLIPSMKKKLGKDYVVTAPPSPAVIKGSDLPSEAALLRQPELVEILYDCNVADEAPSKLRFILSMELAKNWVMALDPSASFAPSAAPAVESPAKSAPAAKPAPVAAAQPMAAPMPQPMPQTAAAPGMDMAAMQQMMAQMQQMQAMGQGSPQQPNASVPYSPWQFAPIAPFDAGSVQMGNMELLRDVSLQVTVELGRTRMPIGQILELVNGSIVELNKQAGEAVELYVQGKLIARGEVVIIDENFGIRITSIVSPGERMGGLAGR